MKKLKPALAFFGVFVVTGLGLIVYDKFMGLDDGLIKGIAFKRVIAVIAVAYLILWLLISGVKSKNTVVQNTSLFSLSLFFCVFAVEAFAFFVIRTGLVEAEKPKHHLFKEPTDLFTDRRPFWGDYNSDFAKWYLPNDTLKRLNCAGDSLFSYTNSFGARDRERQKDSSGKRVLLFGDSFVEGFMVNQEQRMSDLLEKSTGLEHLNFGINGTSPINYYLTYKHLGKDFDHDVVVVGLLPGNDFEDFTGGKKASLIERPIYRPYWSGTYPDYTLQYSLASHGQSAYSLEMFQSPEKLSGVIDSVFCTLSWKDKIKAGLQDNLYTWQMILGIAGKVAGKGPLHFSRYATFSDEEWQIVAHSLNRLFEEAAGKKVIVLVFPIIQDLLAYDATGENRLAGALDSLVKDRPDVGIIDFLPIVHQERKGRWEELYVACDGHWSRAGERYASEILLNHPVYQAAITDTTGSVTPRSK